jgi:hypothetical protein
VGKQKTWTKQEVYIVQLSGMMLSLQLFLWVSYITSQWVCLSLATVKNKITKEQLCRSKK